MSMTIIHGNNLIVSVGNKAIAAAKSCELNVAADTIEIASPNIGDWRAFICGRKNWNVNVNYLLTPRYVTVRPAGIGEVVTLTFSIRQTGPTKNIQGIVSNVPVGELYPTTPAYIYWDESEETFVGSDVLKEEMTATDLFYRFWRTKEREGFQAPDPTATYHVADDGKDYIFDGTTLVPNATLRGNAIVTAVKMVGTRGNLATGSVTFKGSGQLAIIE